LEEEEESAMESVMLSEGVVVSGVRWRGPAAA
jgi:hypothetical protein